jgi:uncharacterized protein (DUF58 family)
MLGLPKEFSAEFLARLEQVRIKTRREYAGMGRGSHLSPRRGSSLEFNDYRHYSPGDDFRYIDWNLFGRTDKLYIKLFKEEEDLLTYIFLDASASMGFPPSDRKLEFAVALVLALAYVALASRDRVMVRVLAGNEPAGQPGFLYGRHRITELARRLTALKAQGRLDFAHALASELIAIKRAGKVFVLSDYLMMTESVTRGLGLFTAADMDVTAVQILGKSELEGQGLSGDLELVDAESGERMLLGIGASEREQYRQTLLSHARNVRQFCFRHGLHYALYNTGENFEDFFLRAVSDLGLVH